MVVEPAEINAGPPVVMFTAPNAGPKTLDGTHTYLAGNPGYLIDPGPDDAAYQEGIVNWLARRNWQVTAILLTHGHPDHAPGATRLSAKLNVPVLASSSLDTSYFLNMPSFSPLDDQTVLPLSDDSLRVIATPGHSMDHLAFWLERSRILFTGDTILGKGTTLVAPPEGNMTDYMATLERLDSLPTRLIAPGHGPLVTEPGATIAGYIAHRREREQQVLRALEVEAASIPVLVARLYVDVDPRLHSLAAGSVAAQLEKLVTEGRVRREGELYRAEATS